MVIVRIVTGIKSHFHTRAGEWFCTAVMLWWGVVLLLPGETFASSPSFTGLAAIWSEVWWGLVCLIVGTVRLIALILNGTFAHTRYGHFSPHVRAAMAFASCFVWFQIVYGLFASMAITPPSTGTGTYLLILALDVVNFRRAMDDTGEAVAAKRHGFT